jgi:hypothetical protein
MLPRLAAVFLVSLAAACASPTPTPSPTPSATPLPTGAPPSPAPTPPLLHVDGLATVMRPGLTLVANPTAPQSRPNRNKEYLQLDVGTEVLLVQGLFVDRGVYWQLYPSTTTQTTPLGWLPTFADGEVNLEVLQPVCPAADGITAAQVASLEPIERVSCYGDRELTLRGTLTCNFGVADGVLAGPMLNSNTWCSMDGLMNVYGSVVTAVPSPFSNLTGSYEVRGHFDDPGAQECYETPFGTSLGGSQSPGDPGAIQQCRTFFVVTSAVEN